jgi:hypothetical protein
VSPGLTAQRSKISQNASIHFASMRSASMVLFPFFPLSRVPSLGSLPSR